MMSRMIFATIRWHKYFVVVFRLYYWRGGIRRQMASRWAADCAYSNVVAYDANTSRPRRRRNHFLAGIFN